MSILDQFRLDGKTALVTGCRRGIGQAMGLALAEAGADIIGVSATLEADSATGRAIARLGRSFSGYACDFGNREAVRRFRRAGPWRASRDRYPRQQRGHHQASAGRRAPDEYWDAVIDVNLTAPFILSREIGQDMLKRGSGKIIFTASLLTFQGGITVPGYAASKGGIGQLTMALSNEWAPRNVQVNAIAPGYIATDNTSALRGDEGRSTAILSRIPAGRWGSADDLKGATVFLASPASDYVTGTILTVDGGWMGR